MSSNAITTANTTWFGTKSHTKRDVTLTVLKTKEKMTMPVEITTKVFEIKWVLCQKLGIEPNDLKFIVRQGPTFRNQLDHEEVASAVTVKGIRSWSREKAQYPHPICVIGGGHLGLKWALEMQHEGIKDYIVYDKLDQPGGIAWVQNANPTSKLQTELAVYHLQYNPNCPVPRKTMKTWPSRNDLLAHFKEVLDEYGVTPHLQLSTEVTEVKVVINNKELPWYDVTKQEFDVITMKTDTKNAEEVEMSFSWIGVAPGALTKPKRVDYKGEDVFEGQIGYGMFDEFDYTATKGETVAIVGFGAFAVENIRTCVEHAAKKTLLICRRKNIACPRCMSWFMNQSVFPPPGAMCLDAFKPMYDLIPDDPWSYYAIIANKDRTLATIRQKARFGIGDVYFLACYYKFVEVIVDLIKRLKPGQILLENGDKYEAQHIIKVLGFDPELGIDKLMGVREMTGFWVNGDWKRFLFTESPGVDAGKFGGTSLSPGAYPLALTVCWSINFPKDFGPAFESGMLPKQKPDKDGGKAAYVWDTRQSSSIQMFLGSGIIPGLAEQMGSGGPLNRIRMHEAHPIEHFIDECSAEWLMYAKKIQTYDAAYANISPPPYPYTLEFMRELTARNDREGEEDAAKQAARMMGA